MMRYIILACFLVSLFACEEKLDESLILGNWEAHDYLSNGQSKDLDPSIIKFSFYANQTYHFQGGLKYREAGNYRIDGRRLYTTDTLNAQRLEKVVKMELLQSDTLFLKMNNGGINEEFRLHKSH